MELDINKVVKEEVEKHRTFLTKLNGLDFKKGFKSSIIELRKVSNDEEVLTFVKDHFDYKKGKKVIYFFSNSRLNKELAKKLNKRLHVLKEQNNKTEKYPKINEIENSSVLYVGSSNNFNKRLEEHLGKCPKSTYALKLNHWKVKGFDRVELFYIDFSKYSQAQMQFVEDALAAELKPLFGKTGANNS